MKINHSFLHLDLLRGVGSLLVFIGHLRALMFLGDKTELNVFGKSLFFITGFGHQAVMIFFVLSGFFIIRSIVKLFERHEWSFKVYLINRLSRLWIVMISALIIGGFFDYFGFVYFQNTLVYQDRIPFLQTLSSLDNLGIEIFFGNFFFLQNIFVTTYGSNSPLWSLANEFWYYMIFPPIFIAIMNFRKNKKLKLFLNILLCVALIMMVGKDISLYFLIWLMGGLSFYLSINYKFSIKIKFITFSLLLIVLFLIRIGFQPMLFNDWSLGFVTCLYVASVASVSEINSNISQIINFFSKLSYSLYVFHFPLILFLTASTGYYQQVFSGKLLLIYFIFIIAVFLIVYLLWYFIERKTPYFRDKILEFIDVKNIN